MLFAPRYVKQALEIVKNVTRLLHTKRDLLKAEDYARLTAKNGELQHAARQRDKAAVERLTAELDKEVGKVVPTPSFPGVRENCETFLVAIVIALGVRAYFVQPFKIPTGSMQPTLNGVIGKSIEGPLPSLPQRGWEIIWNGRSYVHVVSERDDTVVQLQAVPFLWFSTSTLVVMESGRTYNVKCPPQNLINDFGVAAGKEFKAGEPIVHGVVQTGDQVFVDKMTYHFRKPQRGDVFVFTTDKIAGIMNDPRSGGLTQFYIKRLAGVPGDTVRIESPNLYIGGQLASEWPLKRVMSAKNGYQGYGSGQILLQRPSDTFEVPKDGYLALGDNSYASSDSRYWGAVPEKNAVGRGLLVYWPFGQHFGLIK
ncbi:MAG TPA: signal peptidase I [Chthoniobacterales bacterium]|jgi:signal peptidase I